jgi:septum formation protein
MNFNCPLILASSSPRRKFLLEEIGFKFNVISPDIDESFPLDMPPERVPSWLAEKKAAIVSIKDEVVLASDTIVILEGNIMNKPANRDEAVQMLSFLSGQTHKVVTAVCIRSASKTEFVEDVTFVTFRKINREEIEFYIDHYHPLDKAGSYGAQDCLPTGLNPCSKEEIEFLARIGKSELIEKSIRTIPGEKRMVIIDKIDGSYFTVMGLPIHLAYDRLVGMGEAKS